MISPANTYPCLTVNLPGGCDATEPDKYYPSGTRNYARVVPHDAYQGAAVAEFMQAQGVKSVYILNDKEAYGLGVATTLREGGGVPRHQDRGLRGLGSEGDELRRRCSRRSRRPGADARLPRRPDRRERRAGDQGQGRRARPERRRGQAARAGRVHDAGDDRRVGHRRRRACTCPSPACRSTSSRARRSSSSTALQKDRSQGKAIDPYAIYGGAGRTGPARRDRARPTARGRT